MIDLVGMILSIIGFFKPSVPCAIVSLVCLIISSMLVQTKYLNDDMTKRGWILNELIYVVFDILAIITIIR